MRMEEDRRVAENERFIHPNKARLDLLVWQERVWEVLESIDAIGKDVNRKKTSLPDST
jgi:uncharacterized protein YllA (UPF0747 family)